MEKKTKRKQKLSNISRFVSTARVITKQKYAKKQKYSENFEKSNLFKNNQNKLKKAHSNLIFEIIVT